MAVRVPDTSVDRLLVLLSGVLAVGLAMPVAMQPPEAPQRTVVVRDSSSPLRVMGRFEPVQQPAARPEVPRPPPDPPQPEARRADAQPKRRIAPPDRGLNARQPVPQTATQAPLPTPERLAHPAPVVRPPDRAQEGERKVSWDTPAPSLPESRVARRAPELPAPAHPRSGSEMMAERQGRWEEAPGVSLPRTGASRQGQAVLPPVTENPRMPPGVDAGRAGRVPEDFLPAGRIGFSDFRALPSLAGELSRLAWIERTLSKQGAPQRLAEAGTTAFLERSQARVQFPDGVVFEVVFASGRLEEVRIFVRTGLDRRLQVEAEALRGIRFLNQILRRDR